MRLSFLIVGHTHEDIDQQFSIISSVLKRQDIDSVKEMLALIERGASYTEAFTSASLMEHIWDWKKYVTRIYTLEAMRGKASGNPTTIVFLYKMAKHGYNINV